MMQLTVNEEDVKTRYLLIEKYEGAFGSNPYDISPTGLLGDLWVMIPCDQDDVRLMWEATGMKKTGPENTYNRLINSDDMTVQFRAYKFKAGIFGKPFWILINSFVFDGGHEVNAGFFSFKTIPDCARIIDDFMVGSLKPKSSAAEASKSFTLE